MAQADYRISTGVIETHLFAGYSGGVKSIAVGVAGEETIGATHNYKVMQSTRLGVIEGNEFRSFLTEATQAIGLHFVVNVVQTGKKEVVKVVAGDPVEAFNEGVKTARHLYEVEIDQPGEIVVSGVSYPKSRDLYQASRAANVVALGPRPVVTRGRCHPHPRFLRGWVRPSRLLRDHEAVEGCGRCHRHIPGGRICAG